MRSEANVHLDTAADNLTDQALADAVIAELLAGSLSIGGGGGGNGIVEVATYDALPPANGVIAGTLRRAMDSGIVFRSDASAWSVAWAPLGEVDVQAVGCVADGVADDYARWNGLVNSGAYSAANPLTVLVRAGRKVKFNTTHTIPEHVTLKFERGAEIINGDASAVVVHARIEAGPYKIFTGKFDLTSEKNNHPVLMEWWGAKGNDQTFDDRPAWDAMIEAICGPRPAAPSTTRYPKRPVKLLAKLYHTLTTTPFSLVGIDGLRMKGVRRGNILGAGTAFVGRAGTQGTPAGYVMDMCGVSSCSFEGFAVTCDGVYTDVLRVRRDISEALLVTTRNYWRDITVDCTVAGLWLKAGVRVGQEVDPGGNLQEDLDTWERLTITGRSDAMSVANSAIYFQYGLYFGGPYWNNNLNHTVLSPNIVNCRYGVVVQRTNMHLLGGTVQSNGGWAQRPAGDGSSDGADLLINDGVAGPTVFAPTRSEGSGRLAKYVGAGSTVFQVTFRDIEFHGEAMTDDDVIFIQGMQNAVAELDNVRFINPRTRFRCNSDSGANLILTKNVAVDKESPLSFVAYSGMLHEWRHFIKHEGGANLSYYRQGRASGGQENTWPDTSPQFGAQRAISITTVKTGQPNAPIVSMQGATGATSVRYKVRYRDGNGRSGPLSVATSIANAGALDAANFVLVQSSGGGSPEPDTIFEVVKEDPFGSGTYKLLGRAVGRYDVRDHGQALGAVVTDVASDETGSVSIAGDLSLAGLFTGPETIPVGSLIGSGTTGQVPTQQADGSVVFQDPPGAGAGAPTTADYLVKTADAGLSAERVVTDTPTIATDWATAGQAKIGVVGKSIGPAQLADTAVTPGAKGSGTQVPALTVDQQGRLTAAADTPITGAPGDFAVVGNNLSIGGDVVLQRSAANVMTSPDLFDVEVGVRSVSGNTTVLTTDQVLLMDTSGGPATVTIPAAATFGKRAVLIVKTTSDTNAVNIVRTGTDLFNYAGLTSWALNALDDAVTVVGVTASRFLLR